MPGFVLDHKVNGTLKQILEPVVLCTQSHFREIILTAVWTVGLEQEEIQGREVWEGRKRGNRRLRTGEIQEENTG